MDGALTRSRALSLMEVILAIGILAVAVLALIQVFVSGLKLSARSLKVALATEVGREFMEVVRKRGHAMVAPGTYLGDVPTPPDATTGFPPPPYPVATMNQRDFVLVVRAAAVTPDVVSVQVDVYAADSNGMVTGRPIQFGTWMHR